MPRGITIDSKVESQGFTMTSWSKADAKMLSLNSWAQCSDCNSLNTLYENNHWTPKEDKMNYEDETTKVYFEKEDNDCQKPKPDNVNHPSHYESSCSLECIEVMEIMFGLQYVYSFCSCNAWKYIWRYKNKNGTEDLKKARWYIDRAKWYEANHGDEIYYPNKILNAMDDWLLEHDIV